MLLEFVNYIKKEKLMGSIIALLISRMVYFFVISMIDDIIKPIILYYQKKYISDKFMINNIEFNLSDIITNLLSLIVTLFIIFKLKKVIS